MSESISAARARSVARRRSSSAGGLAVEKTGRGICSLYVALSLLGVARWQLRPPNAASAAASCGFAASCGLPRNGHRAPPHARVLLLLRLILLGLALGPGLLVRRARHGLAIEVIDAEVLDVLVVAPGELAQPVERHLDDAACKDARRTNDCARRGAACPNSSRAPWRAPRWLRSPDGWWARRAIARWAARCRGARTRAAPPRRRRA